ncbi:MAG: YfcE family phosphodiesterase [Candidatus Bathyarchaeia archaeon]|jgi:putative phosphoesterase
MSSPSKFQECESDPSYCIFGAETLSKLLEVFEDQIGGVIKSEDIEYVHKMRVTSRRIRATMPLFRICFPKKEFKNWIQEVKKITKLLGEARDLDVQIAFIQQYMEKLESRTIRSGVDLLLKSHKDRRTEIQATVVKGLEELRNSEVLIDINEFCAQTIKKLAKTPFEAAAVLEKAYWYISQKLNDFLAMEKYVYQEAEILKHHEMRIRVKWLRYTMEAFSPLYKSKLAEEITTIKAFQDVLGEMHDCDVWLNYIPKFMVDSKAEIQRKNKKASTESKQALLKFLTYIKENRKNHYSHFVQFWDENKANDFFEQLRETTKTAFTIDENKTRQALLNPNVKIAVLADIHANLQALEVVIQDAEKRGIDIFLNAGDFIGFGPFPNEVIELLQSRNMISVVGNYDLEVIKNSAKGKGAKKLAFEFTKKELADSSASFLLSLPCEIRLEIGGKKVLMVHGSPESIEEHIYHDTPVERLKTFADAQKGDVVIMGHSHEQFRREVDGVLYINPGSLGRPDDGNPQAAYAIMSFSPLDVEFVRLDYDVAAAANALRKKTLPESFAQMLLRGVAIDTIDEEDNARKDAMLQDCKEMVKISQRISKKYNEDTKHCEQVRKLALRLFDSLDNLHQLGKRERCWLECAAILHDIGLSRGVSGHHKKSMKMILNDTDLLYTSEERRIVASIARYHRKGFPKQKHSNLATLNRITVKKIKMLSSLLRIADALDYSHQSIIKNVNVKAGSKKVTIECIVHSDSTLEGQAFNKKKDLFENVFKKNLVLEWKQQ